MDLAELLRRTAPGQDDVTPKISKVGQVALLREFAERYAQPCPFKVGDLVTPRADSPLKWRGEPHIVVGVRDEPLWANHLTEVNSHDFGSRLDMRVGKVVASGQFVCFWNESFEHELYTGDGTADAKADLAEDVAA